MVKDFSVLEAVGMAFVEPGIDQVYLTWYSFSDEMYLFFECIDSFEVVA